MTTLARVTEGADKNASAAVVIGLPALISMSHLMVKEDDDGGLTHILHYRVSRTNMPEGSGQRGDDVIHIAPSDPILKNQFVELALDLILQEMGIKWYHFNRRRAVLSSAKMKEDLRTHEHLISITVANI